jgi:PAP2 superfamily protein
MNSVWIVIGLFVICAWLIRPGISRRRTGNEPLFVRTGPQWRRNYGRRSFLRLGGAVAAAGLLAWTGVDEACDSYHSDVLRSTGTDRAARLVKHLGERFWFLNWGLLAVMDAWLRTSSVSRWGRKNFEAMAVGLPTLWTLQRGLGANRPSSDDANPRWRPMKADNSASGHAFIAAVPLLHLAHRVGNRPARWFLRAASTLTGWSRMNDRKHYLGQVGLGWVIAWNAVEATRDQDSTGEGHHASSK